MKINLSLFALLLIAILTSNLSIAQNNFSELDKINHNLAQNLLSKYTSNNSIKPIDGDTVKTLRYIDKESFEYTRVSTNNSLTYLFNLKKGVIEYTYSKNNKLVNIGELYFPTDSMNLLKLEKFDDILLSQYNKGSCGGLRGLVDRIMDDIEDAIASGQAAGSVTVQNLVSALIWAMSDFITCVIRQQ